MAIVVTDYGEVNVSPTEAYILRLADSVMRHPLRRTTRPGRKLLAQARCIMEACDRFAEFNSGK